MSLAAFSIAEPAIAEPAGGSRGKKPPSGRQIIPKADLRLTPEVR